MIFANQDFIDIHREMQLEPKPLLQQMTNLEDNSALEV